MMTPAWFDEAHYYGQRVHQLNVVKFYGRDDWTDASFRAELARRNITAYQDFEICNDASNLQFTNISPNPLFNVLEYLTALAQYANANGYSCPGYEAGKWTAQKAMEHIFRDYHVSAWDHFTLAGQYDLINPSNAFDIKAHYERLTAQRNNYVDPETGLRGWEGRADWTFEDVLDDCVWAEVNPIAGLWEDGSASGIVISRVPDGEAVAVDPGWNPWPGPVAQPDAPEQSKPSIWPGDSISSDGEDGADPDGAAPGEQNGAIAVDGCGEHANTGVIIVICEELPNLQNEYVPLFMNADKADIDALIYDDGVWADFIGYAGQIRVAIEEAEDYVHDSGNSIIHVISNNELTAFADTEFIRLSVETAMSLESVNAVSGKNIDIDLHGMKDGYGSNVNAVDDASNPTGGAVDDARIAAASKEAAAFAGGENKDAFVANIGNAEGKLAIAIEDYGICDHVRFTKNKITSDNLGEVVDIANQDNLILASVESTEVATKLLEALFKPDLPNDLTGGDIMDVAGDSCSFALGLL